MQEIIKKNVTDCILDKKRAVVEVQTNGNASGKEFVKAIESILPSEAVKEIRYIFGTRDIEIEMVNSAAAEELYKSIDGVLNGKTSNFDPLTLVSAITGILGGVQDTVSGVFKNKYDSQSATQIAIAQAEAQAAIEREKAKTRTGLYIGVGIVVVILIVSVLLILKKR